MKTSTLVRSVIISLLILLYTGAPENSKIVAGGYGLGGGNNELCFPYGLVVDDDRTMIIADWGNHRIIQWKVGDNTGQIIAGGHGQGNRLDQLYCPTDLLIDRETNSLIICDRGNRRVVRWSRRQGATEGEILLENIACWGLAMDNQRGLYISDIEKNEVRRYSIGERNGTIVAGGHGRGMRLNQLDGPNYVFVDQQQAVYVSDTWNHRVVKWDTGATQGTVVVRGSPRGLFVDTAKTVYVADYGSHRLMRWPKDATQGIAIAGGDGKEEDPDQLHHPWGLSSDQHGNLFVVDHLNHRVQRFPLEPIN